MNNKGNVLIGNKLPMIITLAVILIGSIAYFALGAYDAKEEMGTKDGAMALDTKIYKNMQFKVAYTDAKDMKLFVLARNNDLAAYKASEGRPIPEKGSIVIGSAEAQMMKDEALFSGPGDEIEDLFGVDVAVGGVLEKTSGPMDDFHFVTENTYDGLIAWEDIVYVRLTPDGVPKLFYYQPEDARPQFNMTLAEGNIGNYATHEVAGKIYYPLILGADEAAMMREEKLFEKPGDIINGFFGTNVVVIGIMEKTGTPADMMHVIPLSDKEFNFPVD